MLTKRAERPTYAKRFGCLKAKEQCQMARSASEHVDRIFSITWEPPPSPNTLVSRVQPHANSQLFVIFPWWQSTPKHPSRKLVSLGVVSPLVSVQRPAPPKSRKAIMLPS